MAAIPTRGVNAVCKHCGKPSPSTDFVLDPVYRMMVCKNCVADRKLKENPIRSVTAGSSMSRSPVAVSKQSSQVVAVKSSQVAPVVRPVNAQTAPAVPKPTASQVLRSSDKQKKKCPKCGFSYVYDVQKGYPLNCPNCGVASSSQYNFF